MSLALLDRAPPRPGRIARQPWEERKPAIRQGAARATSPATLFELDQPGAATLDELVTATWAGLVKGQTARCPVCHGQMISRAVDPITSPAGDCTKCGATLS